MANYTPSTHPNLNGLASVGLSEGDRVPPTPFIEIEVGPFRSVKLYLFLDERPTNVPHETAFGPESRQSIEGPGVGKEFNRPDWLPAGWQIEIRRRNSGVSAGNHDKYYIEPSGQRKFRSKNEVLHFLETGSKLKRKSPSEGDAEPSGNSATPKQKKSGAKSSKSGAGNEI